MESGRVVLIRYLRDGTPRVGSGLLVGGRVVLTAAHCAAGHDHRVSRAGLRGDGLPANVLAVSTDPVIDLALLQVEPAAAEAGPALGPVRPVRFAAVNTDEIAEIKGCVTVGFPKWKPPSPEGFRNPAQLTGAVPPGEHITRETARGERVTLLAIKSDRHDGIFRPASTEPPGNVPDAPQTKPGELEPTPWAGMSGAAVIDPHDRVLGVIRAHNASEGPGSLAFTPIDAIDLLPPKARTQFRDHLQLPAAGHWPRVPTPRHAEFAQRLFGSPSPLHVADPRANVPPSWWLDPRHRATRFQERPELESLLAWAGDEDPGARVVRLVIGEGGSGKTRLAVELAARLAARGWIAGILTADHLGRLPLIAETLHEILAYGHRVFIALDYPEGMGDELTSFLAQLPRPDEGIVRVLLLARFGGEWWDTLHPAGEIKYLIDRKPVPLTPLGSDEGRFDEALRDYRLKILGPDAADTPADGSPAVPPRLARAAQRHTTAIKLHALALVSALHERDHGTLPDDEVAWADPLDSLVGHERRHWSEAARRRELSCARDPRWAGRVLMVPTLLAVYRGEEARAAISRIPSFAERFPDEAAEAAALLRDLYPADESSSLRWWSPLPLDRLGETLLAAILGSFTEDQAVEYVTALLGAASLPASIQGLTVMTRLSADPQTTRAVGQVLSRCQDALATVDGSRLLPSLLVAEKELPPGVERPGDRYLARLHPADALNLVQRLNQPSVPRLLQETGLVLLDTAERALSTDEAWLTGLPEFYREMATRMREQGVEIPMEGIGHILARALRAEVLMRLGRPGQAIGHAEAAARAMRAVHRASSGSGLFFDGNDLVEVLSREGSDYSKPLLMVLDIYAEALHTVGRLADSAEVRRECAEVAQHAAARGDPDSESAVVSHLCKLAGALLELEKPGQAEPWAREAAERARSLPGKRQHAAALTLWAQTLDQTGRKADAEVAARDARSVLRQDGGLTVDRGLAARIMQDLGHLATPGVDTPDPLGELWTAASQNPAAALPAFVVAALERADHLADQGDLEGASSHMSDAIGQARRLAGDDPDTYLSVLANVLARSAARGRGEDPAGEIAEAITIYRRMLDERGRHDIRADLALALMQHAVMLRDAGRAADSLPGFAEAIELLRPLLAQDRWRNTPYLCTALTLFAETAVEHGDPGQAVDAAREAIDLEYTRTDDLRPTPAEYIPQLRRVLFHALLRLFFARTDQNADPAVLAASAAEIREIGRALPAGILTDGDTALLAGALSMVGAAHTAAGHPEDAVPPLAEGLRILRSTADGLDGGQDSAMLLLIGKDLLSAYRTLNRHAEAARAAAEILADCGRTQPLWEQLRYDCLLMTAEVIAELPRPVYVTEALRLATALAHTSRAWLPRSDLGRALQAAAVIPLGRALVEASSGGDAPDDWPAAAQEVAAGAVLLAEEPSLLRAEHALAVAQAASVLTHAGRLDDALELSTRAVELHQLLAAKHDAPDPRQVILSLFQQGVLLSARGQQGDAIGPLEQALPILLAFGNDIPREHWMLLRGIVDVLRQAYRAVGRNDDERSLIDAVNASGIPLEVHTDPAAGTTGNDFQSALQAAEDEATADPERAVAAFRELLVSPAGAEEYLATRRACRQVVDMLSSAGHLPEALRLCDLMITSGNRVGLEEWARIDDQARRLNVQLDAGMDPQAVLGEAQPLNGRIDELTGVSGAWDGPDLRPTREILLRVSARASLRLEQWPDALRFAQAEASLMRDHGDPLPDVARAEFNCCGALVGMDRIAEAEDVLDRCEAAFRQDHAGQDLDLGVVGAARADLAGRTGDPARAVRLLTEALVLLYRSRNVMRIQNGHARLGEWHRQADLHSPLALAQTLAAATLAELTGAPPDIESIMRALFFRAGECAPTLAAISTVMDEPLGPQFAELVERLAQTRPARTPDETMSTLVQQARDSQRDLFDELARHRMRWDPVFAGIVAARRGNLGAARAVKDTLSHYADSTDWAQLSLALEHILHQRPEAASAVRLDETDAILLRRCTDALTGIVGIPPELAYAMPINDVLAEALFSAQNGQTSPALARALESVAGRAQWQRLVSAIRRILAGERNRQMASGLDQVNAVIIATLLGHLAAPELL